MGAKYIKVNRKKQQSPKTKKKQTNKQKQNKTKHLKKHLTDKPYKRAETFKKKKHTENNRL